MVISPNLIDIKTLSFNRYFSLYKIAIPTSFASFLSRYFKSHDNQFT